MSELVETYTIKALGPETWDAFMGLAERHNGVWNGCWCTWFHPDCAERVRAAKETVQSSRDW